MAEQQAKKNSTTAELKEKLQQQLDMARQRLEAAKKEIASVHEEDKESIRKKSEELKQRIATHQERAAQLREQVASWIEIKKQQTDEQVATWRQKRELKHLEKRADRAAEYAVNLVATAMMDADDAEAAVLDALDARLDADLAAASTP
jgi:DNA mismatch repair ATPase MutS